MIKFNKQKLKKVLWYVVAFVIWIYVSGTIYSLIFEQDKLAIDNYNFEQLEKVKNTLNNLQNFKYNFENLKDFNNKYNQTIKPIKNCYFMQSHNWNYLYIFWFKLESLIYKLRYVSINYVYPKYNLSYDNFCDGWKTCIDWNLSDFKYTISHSCED